MPNLALLALEASDGTVVLTSITLVFAMLVALCLIITLEGKIFDNINNKKNGKPAAPKAPAAKAAPAPAAKPAAPAAKVGTVLVEESPVNLECKVTQVISLGSHDLFLSECVAVDVDERLLDESGKLCLNKAKLIVYSHGDYLALGRKLGSFGYSVRKKKKIVKK